MFKRISLLVIGLMLLSSLAYAAPATVSKTSYGWQITGGTSETLVSTATVSDGRIRIRTISYTAATANNVLTLRSGAVSGARWYLKSAAASNAAGCYIYFGEMGVTFDYLSVQLAEVTDVVNIYE